LRIRFSGKNHWHTEHGNNLRFSSTKNTKVHEERQSFQEFSSCTFVFFVDEKKCSYSCLLPGKSNRITMNKRSKTNLELLDSLTDEEIDTSDISPLDQSFFANAKLRLPETKTTITIRIDPDVLSWFKQQGKGYQSKMNAVLRLYADSHKELPSKKQQARS
jgi:uncharacterized protein (DUF4415 family)